MDPLNALCVVMLVRLVLWFVDEIVSWRHHFLLAEVISQWHRDELKKKMKAKGIKPSHSPLPPPLLALPHRWMVLSCVMLSMWSVALAGPVPQQPPVTWVAALGSVRDLKHSFPPPPPPAPPDPSALCPVSGSLSATVGYPSAPDTESFTDGEGEETGSPDDAVNQLQTLTPDEAAEVLDFTICHSCEEHPDPTICQSCLSVKQPCSLGEATTCPCGDATTGPDWSDFDKHAGELRCFFSRLVPSFGPIGLMSGLMSRSDPLADAMEAFVDTAASMTVTPHKEDFVKYEEVHGQVMKGLASGATIKGRGIVHWRVDVGSKVVLLKLRALHVPSTEHRLLCPQQLRKEHTPKIKWCEIEEDAVVIEFAEGSVTCPCNHVNLPVLSLHNNNEVDDSLKALNS